MLYVIFYASKSSLCLLSIDHCCISISIVLAILLVVDSIQWIIPLAELWNYVVLYFRFDTFQIYTNRLRIIYAIDYIMSFQIAQSIIIVAVYLIFQTPRSMQCHKFVPPSCFGSLWFNCFVQYCCNHCLSLCSMAVCVMCLYNALSALSAALCQ